MQAILPTQNKRLHQLLTMTNTTEMKADLVRDASDGRTDSSKKLTSLEASHLIKHLENKLPNKHWSVDQWQKDKKQKEKESADKMRKKILSRCHTMGWYVRDEAGKLVLKNGKQQLDYKHIDNFCCTKSPHKKRLQEHTYEELRTLVTIFDNVQNHQLNK